MQKDLFARYAEEAVTPEHGHLDTVQQAARENGVTVVLGIIERPAQRSGTSLYCSIVYIDGSSGDITAIHRKIMPTYEERLVWSVGDGAGIVTHPLTVTGGLPAKAPAASLSAAVLTPAASSSPKPPTYVPHPSPWVVGVLNCYETWLPLMRAALHGMGENLHFSLWPGSARNTRDMTRFYALEGRSYAVSVSAVLKLSDILPENVPHHEFVVGAFSTSGVAADADKLAAAVSSSPAGDGADDPNILCDGGSCVAAPDGTWLLSPDDTSQAQEGVFVVEVEHKQVVRERQCLDISGHYSRPDVLQLTVNRQRQATVRTIDGPGSFAAGSVSVLNPASNQ